jgi:uncharacterized protein YkwD
MIQPRLTAISALASLLAVFNIACAEDSAAAYLSPLEQDVVKELNLARTDPKRYGDFLSEMRPYFRGNYLARPGEAIRVTQEGLAAVDEAISFLRSTAPLPALKASRGLSLAAKTHVKDQQSGAVGHRVNMFNPAYRFVGVGCGIHARLGDLCVMEFSAGYIENDHY